MPILEAAPAKLNLALHVTGRRADGYHLLDSLVAFAGMGDRVMLEPGPLSLRIDGPFAAGLSTENNLCLHAARLAGGEAAIRLTKNLPVASGIGGGSADAAAVLRGLARMGQPMPHHPERLGADVPVCLDAGPALMFGIGERIERVGHMPHFSLLLVNPQVPVSTAEVFRALAAPPLAGSPVAPAAPDFRSLDELLRWLGTEPNDLEQPARTLEPLIGEVIADIAATPGCRLARMSGSGATCFGLYERLEEARAAAEAVARKRPGWWVVASSVSGCG